MLYLANAVVGDVVHKKHLLNVNNFDGQLFQWLYLKVKPEKSAECLFHYMSHEQQAEMNQIYNFVTLYGNKIKL